MALICHPLHQQRYRSTQQRCHCQNTGAVLRQIFAVAHPFFSMTNHPLPPVPSSKIDYSKALVIKKGAVAIETGAQRVATCHPLQNPYN